MRLIACVLGAACVLSVLTWAYLAWATLSGSATLIPSQRPAPSNGSVHASPNAAELEAPEHFGETAEGRGRTLETEAPPPDVVETPTSPDFRGRLVDARTGEPVRDIAVRGGAVEAVSVGGGGFDAGVLLPSEVRTIRLVDAFSGADYGSLNRDELSAFAGEAGWTIPVPVGPSYEVKLVGAKHEPIEDWTVTLVETAFERPSRTWQDVSLRKGHRNWVRFHRVQHEPDSSYVAHLSVESLDGVRGGRERVETTVGIHQGQVEVTIDRFLGLVRGRVIDAAGDPRGSARILAVPFVPIDTHLFDPSGWKQTLSDEEGAFELRSLPTGRVSFRVDGGLGQPELTRVVDVRAGEQTLPDFVFPVLRSGGSIHGRTVNGSGNPVEGVVLRLKSTDGGAIERWEASASSIRIASKSMLRLGASAGRFHFANVPPGDYELKVLPLSGGTWRPSSLAVAPPEEGIVFVRDDGADTFEAMLEVFDAETGEPLESYYTQVHASDLWYPGAYEASAGESLGRFGADAGFLFNVHADGYQVYRGESSDFEGEGAVRVARIGLKKGWSATLVLRDAEGRLGSFETDGWSVFFRVATSPPVAGARVALDGQGAGRTDAEGRIELESSRAPERIEIDAPGWTVLGSEHFVDGRILGPPREVVVWMARDE